MGKQKTAVTACQGVREVKEDGQGKNKNCRGSLKAKLLDNVLPIYS